MRELIKGYEKSCELAAMRIGALTEIMRNLRENGGEEEIGKQNLEQRIALLITEHRQMKEIIVHLTGYAREAERCVEKKNIF